MQLTMRRAAAAAAAIAQVRVRLEQRRERGADLGGPSIALIPRSPGVQNKNQPKSGSRQHQHHCPTASTVQAPIVRKVGVMTPIPYFQEPGRLGPCGHLFLRHSAASGAGAGAGQEPKESREEGDVPPPAADAEWLGLCSYYLASSQADRPRTPQLPQARGSLLTLGC